MSAVVGQDSCHFKLIIQVLNYTRKHSYPERRSAFTYIDEEQPTRMDYGKEKFGGPFTEEEVEDFKTVIRLLPLVICLSLSVSTLDIHPRVYLFDDNDSNIVFVVNKAISNWLFPVLLIPLYQLLLYRCFHSFSPSMLRCIGAGLFIWILGYILLSALGVVVGIIVSDDVHRYLSCTKLATFPGNELEWYWKLVPSIFYGIGRTIITVLFFEFIIAQSPDKMKGLVIGISLTCHGFVYLMIIKFLKLTFTLCYDLTLILISCCTFCGLLGPFQALHTA